MDESRDWFLRFVKKMVQCKLTFNILHSIRKNSLLSFKVARFPTEHCILIAVALVHKLQMCIRVVVKNASKPLIAKRELPKNKFSVQTVTAVWCNRLCNNVYKGFRRWG